MMQRKKRFNKNIFLVIAVAVAFLGLMATIVSLTCYYHKDSKTPLGWCIWEIQHNENYEEFTYTYEKLKLPEGVEPEKPSYKHASIYSYVIKTYTDEFVVDWYCFIECYHKDTFDNAVGAKLYRPDEIIAIDCDEIPGTLTYYEED